ncbi:unnamed protein product [Adineta steineri]|uniref:Uncharacterized protein n=1 Tax=Adineta steineri TaxID=433720 RepID=A0A815RAL9_9BILA|nr:unnamed protein product [Adineta steineri]CAF4121291.1 unnamed protein product [Adineta steineri]
MSSHYILLLILRISVFGTFFGHGCLALRFVPGWLPYLGVVGIGTKWARILMPVIGLLDIVIAFVCLFMHACPLVYCWAFVWGLATALIRPIAGESIFGFIERTGNFCSALALLWLAGGQDFGYYLMICTLMTSILAVFGVIFRVTGLMKN